MISKVLSKYALFLSALLVGDMKKNKVHFSSVVKFVLCFECAARKLSHKYVITQSTSKIVYIVSKLVSMQNRTFAISMLLFILPYRTIF